MTNVYELTGEKVILKNMPEYLVNIWYYMYDDEELQELDPAIGVMEKPQYYSIHAVYSPEIVIGMMSTYNYTDVSAEMGIRIWNRNYWNRGYGEEAMRLLMGFIFDTTKNPDLVIVVKTPVTNIRAQKCYKKIGFTLIMHTNIEGHDMTLMGAQKASMTEKKEES